MEIVTGGPTKSEIAAITLLKLKPSPGDVVADIGCGTGSISILAAKKAGFVYAIDFRKEAITVTEKNIKESGINNIKLIQGEAPGILDELPLLDCAFIGGTRNIKPVLQQLKKKVKNMIVVNAVRIQTVSNIIRIMQEMEIFSEVVHVQVSKSYELAGEIAFKPINPVYIIVGDVSKEAYREVP